MITSTFIIPNNVLRISLVLRPITILFRSTSNPKCLLLKSEIVFLSSKIPSAAE